MSRKGLSVAEIAIVLLIVSAVFGGAISMLPNKKEADDLNFTESRIKQVDKAIKVFFKQYGYLPCPASRQDVMSSANFGVSTNCSAVATGVSDVTTGGSTNIRIGAIPTRTLNLPDSYMFDAWDDKITYAMIKELGVSSANFNTIKETTTDVLIIKNASGTRVNTGYSATNKNFTAYLLTSHGKNRVGAYNNSNVMGKACSGTGLDLENCDNDDTFINTSHNLVPASYYDDFMHIVTRAMLFNESGVTDQLATAECSKPSDIYGLIVWLDANDATTITKDGSGYVSSWTNKSSYGGTFINSGAAKPLYSASAFNGKPTMVLTGTNGFKKSTFTTTPSLESSNWTIFFAGQQNAVNNANYLVDMQTGVAQLFESMSSPDFAYYLSQILAGNASLTINLNKTGSNFWYKQSATLTALANSISSNTYASWVFIDGASNEAELFDKGALVTSANPYSPVTLTYCIKIGQNCASGSTGDFSGNVSEIIIYNRALTDSDRAIVEQYMKDKWNL